MTAYPILAGAAVTAGHVQAEMFEKVCSDQALLLLLWLTFSHGFP